MIRHTLILIPLLLSLTGCDMHRLINESTDSINANCATVERSTEAIRQNTATIRSANQAVEENHRLLEQASKS